MPTATAASERTHVGDIAAVCAALADPTRLRILALLGGQEVCVCHIHDSLDIPQPTASRHLAYLRRTGLVEGRRDGLWVHYRIAPDLAPHVRHAVEAVVHAARHCPEPTADDKELARATGTTVRAVAPTVAGCCAPSVTGRGSRGTAGPGRAPAPSPAGSRP